MDIGSGYLSQLSSSVLEQKAQTDLGLLGQRAGEVTRQQEVEAIAQDFEAVFVTQMLQHMFDGIETNELFGGGHAEETFQTLLFDEYGKTIAKAGGVGVASHVQQQLLGLQEV